MTQGGLRLSTPASLLQGRVDGSEAAGGAGRPDLSSPRQLWWILRRCASVIRWDIADSCVRTWLTLVVRSASGWVAGGLVVACAVEGEAADESVGSEGGDVVASGDDEEALAD